MKTLTNSAESSTYQLYITRDQARRVAGGWLILGVSALALAGLFAIMLVLSRTPGTQVFFPWLDFFRTALVVHVDLSVLIWFLAFAGMLWNLEASGHWPMRWLAFALATAGTLVITISPFTGAGDPLLNNYVPVLRQPLFLLGLGLFGLGVSLQMLLSLLGSLRQHLCTLSVATIGVMTAVLASAMALTSLIWSYLQLSGKIEGQGFFEFLFWGSGHALQFTYTQMMLVAWLWMAQATNLRLGRAMAGPIKIILLLGVAPVLLVPAIHLAYDVMSGESRLAFTRLMQWGGGIAAIPIGCLLLFLLWRGPAATPDQRPVRRALAMSILLFASGGLIGWLISGLNTVIPAHYHGSIVGVTLALMGLTYQLLPSFGFSRPTGRMASMQPLIYAIGQLLHVGGLAVSGALGIQRKTAGSAQGLEDLPRIVAMGVMGFGGLLAVIGGILFIVVVLRAIWRRPST